jgi:hypothetical protein
MPFQNAPAIVACGAKIGQDDSIVVRYNKKSKEYFLCRGNASDFY